jgi:peptidoglycan/xylan/chitin deacetylase (PgdA/CDA1 family)
MMGVVFTCSTDDGYPSDMKMGELLSKHNLNGTFYVPIKNCQGPAVMTYTQIRELARHFEIGSHTYDHVRLKEVGDKEAQYQIIEGKKHLEDVLGMEVPGFCYPGGKYRQRDARLVRDSGFKYARTTVNFCFDPGKQPFEIPTTIQFYPHDKSVYVRNFAKSGQWLNRHDGLRLAMQHDDWIVRLYALFDHACKQGSEFHLWGHSKEIDELNAWRELDKFLGYVSSKVAPENRLSNEQVAARRFQDLALLR